ncbi:carbohydrate sulfotransferase [Biomphalaria glabrata]|nr:hypothetical protein BgiMline_028398 [Biomphalaria glabrata]
MFSHLKIHWRIHFLECFYFYNLINAYVNLDAFLVNSKKGAPPAIRTSTDDLNSCRNRCQEMDLAVLQIHCSCVDTCFAYKNCCYDIEIECPLVVQQGLERYGHMFDVQVECMEMGDFLAVASCPGETNYSQRLINRDSVYDIIINTPVQDPSTSIVFANQDIYRCNFPNGSNKPLKWRIYLSVTDLPYDNIISRIEQYKFHSPIYRESHVSASSLCLYRTFKWCDQQERTRCPNPITWISLQRLRCQTNKCTVCRLNASNLCVSEPYDLHSGSVIMTPKLHELVLSADNLPWSQAECRMSTDVTLSSLMCRFVNCTTHLGFHLHQDGSCRKFNLLFIAFPGDGWRIDPEESSDILDYMTYYLIHVLNIKNVWKVEPKFTLYHLESKQNVSVSTFVIDYNSSAPEDFLFLRYSHELSILAKDVRTMVDIKLNKGQKEMSNLSLAYPHHTAQSRPPFFRWCQTNNLAIRRRNYITFLASNSTEKNFWVCLCRSLYKSENLLDVCIYVQCCEFQCFYGNQLGFHIPEKESSTSSTFRHANILGIILFVVVSKIGIV